MHMQISYCIIINTNYIFTKNYPMSAFGSADFGFDFSLGILNWSLQPFSLVPDRSRYEI